MRQRIPFRRIDGQTARALLERTDTVILDIRDADSFERGHIAGALRVSQANVSAILAATGKARPILIYCYHGNASQEYGQIFSDFGFTDVCSLDGGYEAWRALPPVAGDNLLDETLQRWLAAEGFAPDVNALIANATTPLMKAAHKGDADVVGLLIAAGAEINAQNADGNNALWLACVGGHPDVIDMLVAAGIEIDNRNVNGATPLMYASSAGKDAIVARLLAKGADVTPETPDGFSALDLAGTIECLALLRPARAAKVATTGEASRKVPAGS